MEIVINKTKRYICIDETKIDTGNSIVYQAQDTELDRKVCIKSITIKGSNRLETENKLKKAMSEVNIMMKLAESTRRIPYIYDVFFDDRSSQLHIIMQWIKGKSLGDMMNVPSREFIRWIIDLCEVLVQMEKKNMYHKDIKPSNIIIDDSRYLYLIDFNLSASLANRTEGTINYRAPEMEQNSQYPGREKVDIFAIGVMLYEFYTKEVPVRGNHYYRKSQRVTLPYTWDSFIEPITKAEDMPKEINDIIVKCMKLNHRDRYQNIRELLMAIKAAERSVFYGKRK